ncbi:MAG: CDC48 family AAA ATPase [Planctomycetota bacterium]
MKDDASVTLRVAAARKKDAGRNIVRVDPSDLERLGIGIGSFVRLTGKRTTVCKAMPTFPDARGGGKAHIDGIARDNARAGLDESVTLAPVEIAVAETVRLEPRSIGVGPRDLDYIGSLLDGVCVTVGDAVRATLFGSRTAEFVVASCSPGREAVIGPTTRLIVSADATSRDTTRHAGTPTYEDIGGLGPQLARIRETIELPLRFPHVFERLGIDPPKGVLLHGPPGTGKTLIARTIAHESDAAFFTVSGPEIVHRHYGESEKLLREIWDKAARQGPSIIFLDEIDSIAPKRQSVEGEVEKRIVAQLLALMDGLKASSNVVVIAATNLPNSIDPALRRPGRFDREIEISIPDWAGRRQILDVHTRGMPLGEDVDLDELAASTHGCVGADLHALCREAAMACVRTTLRGSDFAAGSIPYEKVASLEISMEHFRQGRREVEPSAMREVLVEVPSVSWDDIGGLGQVKQRLREAVEWPLRHARLFRAAGVRPPKGILLAGPPGVGKTMTARAAATQTEANFISVKGPELVSKFVGESEARLREIFRKARQAAPCIVFFDEIDALLPQRGLHASDPVGDRVLAQFLSEVDGVEALNGVLVLGATNRLDRLDDAMLRPGRFDEVIELAAPDHASRIEIFRVQLRDRPCAEDVDAEELARACPGATGAQIAGAVRRGGMSCVRRAVRADADAESRDVMMSQADLLHAIREEYQRSGESAA